RETHGARLTQPAGRSVAIELRPGANRPTVPAPADPGRGEGEGGREGAERWGAVVRSPDGRGMVATRNAAGRWGPVGWPADRPLPFDSAPPLAVPARETGYAVWPSLRPRFWIPFFLNAGPTGRFGGAVTAGTDALHRFTYAADLLLAPQPFRVTGDFILLSDVL